MRKLLLSLFIISSIATKPAYLSSAIFPINVETTSKWSIEALKKTASELTIEGTKKIAYETVKSTLKPLTSFAYDNMILAAASGVIIAYSAYKAGKFINEPVYKEENVEQVIVVAKKPKNTTPKSSIYSKI